MRAHIAASFVLVFILGGLVGAHGMREIIARRAPPPPPPRTASAPARDKIRRERDIRDGQVIAERVVLPDGRVIPVPPTSTATARIMEDRP